LRQNSPSFGISGGEDSGGAATPALTTRDRANPTMAAPAIIRTGWDRPKPIAVCNSSETLFSRRFRRELVEVLPCGLEVIGSEWGFLAYGLRDRPGGPRHASERIGARFQGLSTICAAFALSASPACSSAFMASCSISSG
jgi:hypothetical protein